MATQEEYDALPENGWERQWIDEWVKELKVSLKDLKITDDELIIKIPFDIQKPTSLSSNLFIINRKQYEMVIDCSQCKDCSQWNNWKEPKLEKLIFLDGADFTRHKYLNGIDFSGASLKRIKSRGLELREANLSFARCEFSKLRHAILDFAIMEVCHLDDSELYGASFKETDLTSSFLPRADLRRTFHENSNFENAQLERTKFISSKMNNPNFKNATLTGANFKGIQGNCNFEEAHLENAHFENATLQKTRVDNSIIQQARIENSEVQQFFSCFRGSHLKNAILTQARLQGCDFVRAELEGAKFIRADISKTQIPYNVIIDTETDFTGSNLADALIDPGIRGALEYNIRRRKWHDWYKGLRNENKEGGGWKVKTGRWLLRQIKWIPRWFWSVSDYGISSLKIVGWFMVFAVGFGFLYFLNPGWLHWSNNMPTECCRRLLYSLYFSVVTMTTLGFGDIHANPESAWGQFFLTIQVILGYVLLGALVTRLGVVFTGLGPVQKPKLSPEDKEERKRLWVAGGKLVMGIVLLGILARMIWCFCG